MAYERSVATDFPDARRSRRNTMTGSATRPPAPTRRLWHAINVLREQRGDGHIAALQVAGLDPCEALVSFAAIGAAPAEVFASRGWSAAEWSAARDRLTARGWIDAEGTATERGREGRDEIEWRTDRLADAPWRALGADRAVRLAELTRTSPQVGPSGALAWANERCSGAA
jgi:hypothetical protein